MTTTNNTGHSLDAAKTSGLSPPCDKPKRPARSYTISYRASGTSAHREHAEAAVAALLALLFLGMR